MVGAFMLTTPPPLQSPPRPRIASVWTLGVDALLPLDGDCIFGNHFSNPVILVEVAAYPSPAGGTESFRPTVPPFFRASSPLGLRGASVTNDAPRRSFLAAQQTYRLIDFENAEIGRRCISTGPSPLDLGIGAMA